MNQQEFRSRVRKLQDLIDAELRRRGVDPINQQEETRDSKYMEVSDIIDVEFWEYAVEPPKPKRRRVPVGVLVATGFGVGLLLAGAL